MIDNRNNGQKAFDAFVFVISAAIAIVLWPLSLFLLVWIATGTILKARKQSNWEHYEE